MKNPPFFLYWVCVAIEIAAWKPKRVNEWSGAKKRRQNGGLSSSYIRRRTREKTKGKTLLLWKLIIDIFGGERRHAENVPSQQSSKLLFSFFGANKRCTHPYYLLERIAQESSFACLTVSTRRQRDRSCNSCGNCCAGQAKSLTPPPTTKRERDETETKHARNNQSFLYSDRSNHVPRLSLFFPNARGYFKMLVTLFAQDGNEPTG